MAKNNQKVNTDFFQGLAREYNSNIDDSMVVDVVTFAEANWGLNIRLYPMQAFILKCFYGLPLSEHLMVPIKDPLNTKIIMEMNEVELINYLIREKRTNMKAYEPGKKYRSLLLCCGRRASKSVLTSIIASYEMYLLIKHGNPQAYYGFPSGQDISISALATSDEQASVLFNMIKSRVFNCNYLKDRIVNNTQTYFNVASDEDIKKKQQPTMRVLCGSAASAFLRGPNNILVVMDEVAHMDITKNAARDAYDAITPSIATFMPASASLDDDDVSGDGKIVMLSTPLAKSGFFFEKYQESFQNSGTLMFQMYSTMINPRIDPEYLREKHKNKEMFQREFCAEFSDNISPWLSETAIEGIVDKNRTTNAEKGKAGVDYYMGIDFGVKNDGAAITIVHKEDGKIIHDYSEVFYAANSDVWEEELSIYRNSSSLFADRPEISIGEFADVIVQLCKQFNVVDGWFDQFNGYGLHQSLMNRNLTQFRMVSASASLNTKVFQLAKSLIDSEMISLINHDVLVPELGTLEEQRSSSYLFVKAPARAGMHDDISDSLIRAIYACYDEGKKKTQSKHVIAGGRQGSLSEGGYYKGGSARRNVAATLNWGF